MSGFRAGAAACLLAAFVLAGAFSCGDEKDEMGPDVLATVEGEPVRVEDLRRAWTGLPPEQRRRYQGAAGVDQLLDEIIAYKLMVLEAGQRNLDQDPEVKERLETYRHHLLVNALLDRIVTEADIFRHFQENFIRAGFIKVPFAEDAGEAEKKAAEKEAGRIYAKLTAEDAPGFLEFARSYGQEAEDKAGGDMGYVTHETVTKFAGFMPAEALFNLEKPGDLSAPVEGNDGFYIFQLIEPQGRLDPRGLTDEMRTNLREIKREEAVRSLANEIMTRDEFEIKRNTEAIRELMEKARKAEASLEQETAVEGGSTAAAPAAGAAEEE